METHFIAIHVGAPAGGMATEFFPSGNWIGATLLNQLISLALSCDGLIEKKSTGSAGELNDFVFMAEVSDVNKAVETIKHVFRLTGLPYQIGVRQDHSWCCVYPSSEIRMSWLMDTERHEMALAQLNEDIKAKQKLIVDLLGLSQDGQQS